MPDAQLAVENVTKTYDMGKVQVFAVRGISFTLHQGDFVFVIGPSGCGKTTLLDMMGTLSKPTDGKVSLNGKDVSKLDKYESAILRRDKFGFIFQAFNLIPTLSAVDNVLLSRIPDGTQDEYREKAIDLLKMVGLEHRLHHLPAEMSGGEKQRVTIARAMLNDPELVFADEPTGEVDSHNADIIMNYMREVNKKFGTTFVIVTHETDFICKNDKVISLKDGKITETRNFRH